MLRFCPVPLKSKWHSPTAGQEYTPGWILDPNTMAPTTLTCALANVRKLFKAKSSRGPKVCPLTSKEIVALEAKLETMKEEQRKRAAERHIQRINLCTAHESSRVIQAVQESSQQSERFFFYSRLEELSLQTLFA